MIMAEVYDTEAWNLRYSSLLIALIELIRLSVSLALKKTEINLFKVITLFYRRDQTIGNEATCARAQCASGM